MTREATGDDELRVLIQRVARRIRNNRGDAALSDSQLGVLFHLEIDEHSPQNSRPKNESARHP